MKRCLFLFALLWANIGIFAQAISLEVDCQNPGWLSNTIAYGDQQTIQNLKVTGYINSDDLKFIGTMICKQSLRGCIDLEDANIVGKGTNEDNVMLENAFNIKYDGNYPDGWNVAHIIFPLTLTKSTECLSEYLMVDTISIGSESMPSVKANDLYDNNGRKIFNKRVKHLILRNGVTEIPEYAFSNYALQDECRFESVTFPSTLTKIEKWAFKKCFNLKFLLPDSVEEIGSEAFIETSFLPDTLDLPLNLKTFNTDSFTTKTGQVIILKENVEEFNNRSWTIKKSTQLTFVIHRTTPPIFRKGVNESSSNSAYNTYSDGKELSGCTIYVPKEGCNMYQDSTYDSLGGWANQWSGWSNPYSHAKIHTIYIPVTSIEINVNNIELVKGNTMQLSANVLPIDADFREYSWSSSNPNIVSVSSTGMITANSSGEAFIYATLDDNNKIVDSCKVRVYQPVTGIALNTKEKALKVGESYSFIVTINPNDADNKNIIWVSENPEVASVENGVVTALKAGTVKITAISEDNNNVTDYCELTITQPVTGIYLNYTEYKLGHIGSTVQLEATIIPEDASNKDVNWKSSNENVCIVSGGKVVAVGYGTAIVIVTTVDGGYMATCTIVVEETVYAITYIVDGEVYATDSLAYGSEIVLIDEPTKEGHTFSGWSEAPETMPAEDITITGSFSVNTYTITYIVDGEVYATDSLAYGSEIVLIDEPTKEGYTFSGWSEVPETMPAEDITITGSFSVNTYAITYIVDGEVYATDSLAYGSEIVLIDEPTKEGYTFSGWSEVPETMPAEDIEITGSFSVNTYVITYIVDGEAYATDSLTYGSEIVLIDEPTKEGYTFSGWSEVPETMPAYDVEITGSFSVNTYAITYMVDGEVYATDSLAYGSEIVLIDEPTKEGYTFSGWSEAPETMPANDITITGSFSVNSYTITYIVDGEVYATDSLAYGSEIVLIDEHTKEGYTFSGWSEAPETMPAYDVEITGSFSVNTYAITYMVDGEVYATDSLAYGSEIVLIDEPTKEGYTFSGWSEAPETMPAEDITITGSFSVNTYAITYIVDGEVYATDSLAYGSEIVLIDEPTKEGYTFSGWSEAPETMPAEDIEITGSFIPTENVSEVEFDANIQTTNNGIILLNANNNWVRVYAINGILVKKIDNYTGEEITLNKGVYIVSVGNKAIKIML